MFWQKYVEICEKNNVRPRKVAAEIGVADATVTRWKNGSTPNRDTLEKIAKKFDVSVEYLMDSDEITINVKDKHSTFMKLTALPQRWASLHGGSKIDAQLVTDISKYVNASLFFLSNDNNIAYTPENEEYMQGDNSEYWEYRRACISNIGLLHNIFEILDDCADSDPYRILQIQLSRIVLAHLSERGINKEQLTEFKQLSSYKLEFLYTGVARVDPTYNYGLNFSDLSVIRRKTGLSYLYMFTGIEESYAEIVAELSGK